MTKIHGRFRYMASASRGVNDAPALPSRCRHHHRRRHDVAIASTGALRPASRRHTPRGRFRRVSHIDVGRAPPGEVADGEVHRRGQPVASTHQQHGVHRDPAQLTHEGRWCRLQRQEAQPRRLGVGPRGSARRDAPLLVLFAANYSGMTIGPGPGLLERSPRALEAAEEATARGVSGVLEAHPRLRIAGATEVTSPSRPSPTRATTPPGLPGDARNELSYADPEAVRSSAAVFERVG